ncbi:hypothetical protein U1Q18_049718 [Sarracenia purpurea var. burkii]
MLCFGCNFACVWSVCCQRWVFWSIKHAFAFAFAVKDGMIVDQRCPACFSLVDANCCQIAFGFHLANFCQMCICCCQRVIAAMEAVSVEPWRRKLLVH